MLNEKANNDMAATGATGAARGSGDESEVDGDHLVTLQDLFGSDGEDEDTPGGEHKSSEALNNNNKSLAAADELEEESVGSGVGGKRKAVDGSGGSSAKRGKEEVKPLLPPAMFFSELPPVCRSEIL